MYFDSCSLWAPRDLCRPSRFMMGFLACGWATLCTVQLPQLFLLECNLRVAQGFFSVRHTAATSSSWGSHSAVIVHICCWPSHVQSFTFHLFGPPESFLDPKFSTPAFAFYVGLHHGAALCVSDCPLSGHDRRTQWCPRPPHRCGRGGRSPCPLVLLLWLSVAFLNDSSLLDVRQPNQPVV